MTTVLASLCVWGITVAMGVADTLADALVTGVTAMGRTLAVIL